MVVSVKDDPFVQTRKGMVEQQLKAEGITDPLVLTAMEQIPRHLFIPEPWRYEAYDNCAVPIGEGQTISQPFMVAVMTQALNLRVGEKILEIGTGSGYQAAILGWLAKEVYTVERIEPLVERARIILHTLGFDNVHVRLGDGTLGLPEEAPFDRILITAGAPAIPPALMEQLAWGGILVAPIGDHWMQELTIVAKEEGGPRVKRGVACVFVPLIGQGGWRPEPPTGQEGP
ncbi:MAG: protein-L-isoaspartate(D-aspartate) O-methyltransferase [Candidatus Methylomirabilales bacterium]|nr:protein-L-isoaspartate(D-aspartate) O-methyltransferase [candidate division NC10 bacterium]MCZ6549845.1 protein-L-isoaspartate(D-aspartate) O-methyltransferase [candidate division NC10 bacterium]